MKRLYFNISFLKQLIRNDFFFVQVLQEKQTKQYITFNQLLSTSTGIWQESGWNVCHFRKKSVSITHLTVSKSVLVLGSFLLMVFA